MVPYANRGGNSGVRSYEIDDDSIVVEFKDESKYLYNYTASGKAHVEEMKRLANAGQGLNSYISRHVKKNYAKKLR
jgi:hypothetical protein